MSCSCDYDPPEFYHRTTISKARKEHGCYECGGRILQGESYEHVFAKWDGDVGNVNTCQRCLDLREYVKAHVPCFCWAHGNVIDDAIETVRSYAQEVPGLMFGAYRRQVAIRAARKQQWKQRT